MNPRIPPAVFWARRADAALIMNAAAAFWGMAINYLVGIALLFTPTK